MLQTVWVILDDGFATRSAERGPAYISMWNIVLSGRDAFRGHGQGEGLSASSKGVAVGFWLFFIGFQSGPASEGHSMGTKPSYSRLFKEGTINSRRSSAMPGSAPVNERKSLGDKG